MGGGRICKYGEATDVASSSFGTTRAGHVTWQISCSALACLRSFLGVPPASASRFDDVCLTLGCSLGCDGRGGLGCSAKHFAPQHPERSQQRHACLSVAYVVITYACRSQCLRLLVGYVRASRLSGSIGCNRKRSARAAEGRHRATHWAGTTFSLPPFSLSLCVCVCVCVSVRPSVRALAFSGSTSISCLLNSACIVKLRIRTFALSTYPLTCLAGVLGFIFRVNIFHVWSCMGCASKLLAVCSRLLQPYTR